MMAAKMLGKDGEDGVQNLLLKTDWSHKEVSRGLAGFQLAVETLRASVFAE